MAATEGSGGARDVWTVGAASGLALVADIGPAGTMVTAGAGAACLGLLDLEGGGEKGAATLG